MLWITFKSCIFAFWNNDLFNKLTNQQVVNYIQILYLCILKQHFAPFSSDFKSCELHSNLVSLHSETTLENNQMYMTLLWITFKSCIFAFWNNISRSCICVVRLWITFKSCIFAFWNNNENCNNGRKNVVNYIQILYLCILKQHISVLMYCLYCCELHSNLVSLHSETTAQILITR